MGIHEMFLVLVFVLVVFAASKIPALGDAIGRAMRKSPPKADGNPSDDAARKGPPPPPPPAG
jgi:Sec-independent protein translocase protein TatA